ncbi:response regulator transcription factor [Streptomyces sp. NPDC058642]|uniref:response regulator transcription factor n=1 Tax=unclassified Streptomyces TaxID=2593676 RepID=UPI000A8B317E|nr:MULTISPECIES: helix-turn-helix transcriptional regulator [unclassified Streptomyces]
MTADLTLMPGPVPDNNPPLSPRERQVLAHIAAGFTHSQTSRRLHISPSSVETYLQRIRHKLDAPTLAHLVRAAIELGL